MNSCWAADYALRLDKPMLTARITIYCPHCDWSAEVENLQAWQGKWCPDCSQDKVVTDETIRIHGMVQNFITVYRMIAGGIPELQGKRLVIRSEKLEPLKVEILPPTDGQQ